MYKIIVFFSFSIVLLFTGCGKNTTTVKYKIERNGELVIDRVSDIIKKYALTNDYYLKEHNTSYEIGFPMRLIDTLVKGDGPYPKYISSMNVDLCKNKQVVNKDIKNILEEFPLRQGNDYVFYFSLEKMINKNLIKSDNIQEDICFYINSEIRTYINDYVVLKSNVITFTADEINTVRAEYERLTK
jgi:hypothetical protein